MKVFDLDRTIYLKNEILCSFILMTDNYKRIDPILSTVHAVTRKRRHRSLTAS